MEWLLDGFGARTTKIWPFEAIGALGTTATAKAPRGSGGLPKKMCLGSPIEPQHRGVANDPREYHKGGVVSLPTPKCPSVTQGSPGVVWLVLPHHGDSHIQGS